MGARLFGLVVALSLSSASFVARAQSHPRTSLAVLDGTQTKVPERLAETFRPAIRLYTDRDGLPQNTVESMAVDRDGYLWAATQDGLARFDGHAWTVYLAPDHELSNFFHKLLFDDDGALYVGREIGGVARLDHGLWTTWGEDRGVPRGKVVALAFAPDETGKRVLWVGSEGGLAKRSTDDVWTTITDATGLPHLGIESLLVATDESGERVLHVGTQRGLFRLSKGRFVEVELPPEIAHGPISVLFETLGARGEPTLWVGTPGRGAARRSYGVWNRITTANGLPYDAVQAFAETRGTNGPIVWVGTDGGIAKLADGRWTTLQTGAKFPTNSVVSLLSMDVPDGERSLWVGLDGGLARIGLGGVSSVDHHGEPFSGTFATLATTDDDGEDVLYVGGRGTFVSRFAHGVWQELAPNPHYAAETVFAIHETRSLDGVRALWIGTQSVGLIHMEGDHIVEQLFGHRNVRHIRQSKTDDGSIELWVATGVNGVMHLEHGAWTNIGTHDGLPTNELFCTEETIDPDGLRVVWFGTQGAGLVRHRRDVWTVFDAKTSALRSDSVTGMHVSRDPRGRETLWAGTEGGGVAFFDPTADTPDINVLTDATTPAIANNTVYQVREDARRRIDLFTNRGVSRLTRRSLTGEDGGQLDVATLTLEDGLPGNEFNGGSTSVDAHGRVFAGAVAGVAVIDSAREIQPSIAPPLRLSHAELLGSSRELIPGMSLAHDEASVAFDYTSLAFVHESDTRYRAELLGLTSTPSPWTTDRRREYTNLPAGSYTFRISARDQLGHIAGPIDTHFSVRQAPWRTWWAIAIYAAFLGLATWLVVRLRLAALTRQNTLLEERIALRTRELGLSERRAREAEDEARRANRAKSVFLSTMSHELRTPLNAILGFSQLLARGRLVREDKDSVDVIVKSGEHLLGLINDVLNISKIEAGKLTLVEDTFSLTDMIRAIEKMVAMRAQSKGLRLSAEVAEGVPETVRGDEGKLRQIVLNLAGNAVKFTSEGGVALRASWREGVAVIEIEDSGPGVSEDEAARLFESFAQSETGRRTQESTGLGLHISRSFARAMGGDVTMKSRLGVGTLFRVQVRLPKATHVSSSTPSARKVVGLAPGEIGRRVLVADDIADNRAILRRLLSPMGFEVAEAANGAEAVERWESFLPHIVFMDMRMEVMDGAAATAKIREREKARGLSPTKLVALSASAFEEDREAILAAGCDDFVSKPYREATIFQKLTEHLGVRFAFEDTAPESLPVVSSRVTPKSFRSLPAKLRADLSEAVSSGDVRASRDVIAQLAAIDPGLAEDLKVLVDAFRFEEIEARLAVEGASS